MDGWEKRRKKGEQGRSERVCVQVWNTERWITQPKRQFITVREREGKREWGEKKGEGGEKRERDIEEKGPHGGKDRYEVGGGQKRGIHNSCDRETH